ncbi:MAG: imidazole glycerol phosphate synthase subunit HisH [Acidimicrobiaceae bacterium]|nr:imidazole glycerol phosphate synthase subunit HisH [Acidimicrobiaceae bacterium]
MSAQPESLQSKSSDSRPLIAIVDYGIGNLHSAHKAFEHLGANVRLTADKALIDKAAGVVLPGVGAFRPCMTALRHTKLDTAILDAIDSGCPFLGICIGMQVLFAESDEAPGIKGLSIFPQKVRWLSDSVKKPQMQWNILQPEYDHPMFAGLDQQPWMYFVHSLAPEQSKDVIAVCDYGGSVVAAVARDNVWAVQFHPEKSSTAGLRILDNFTTAVKKTSRTINSHKTP